MSTPLTGGNKIPKGYKTGQLQQFTPEQMNLFKQSFAFADPNSELYQRAMGSEQGFAPFEQRAQRDFQDFQGQTASRFSGLGLGARHGSGFQNAQTQGAQDFSSSLAEKREGMKRQALQDLMGLSQNLLGQRPYEQFITKKQKPWWQQFLLGINEKSDELVKAAAKAAAGGAFG